MVTTMKHGTKAALWVALGVLGAVWFWGGLWLTWRYGDVMWSWPQWVKGTLLAVPVAVLVGVVIVAMIPDEDPRSPWG